MESRSFGNSKTKTFWHFSIILFLWTFEKFSQAATQTTRVYRNLRLVQSAKLRAEQSGMMLANSSCWTVTSVSSWYVWHSRLIVAALPRFPGPVSEYPALRKGDETGSVMRAIQ